MNTGLYVGLISGTSMDGVDAALVRIDESGRAELLAHHVEPYPAEVRQPLADAIQRPLDLSAVEMSRLDGSVGEVFATAARNLIQQAGVDSAAITAIGSHGQTLYHGPEDDPPVTVQIGRPSRIAEANGIDVVADFRAADLAAGGQAAPLAPAIHATLLADPAEHRAVVNIGGIANVTRLPRDHEVTGFDTGPGNCLMDDWIGHCRSEPRDNDGSWAASGITDPALLDRLLEDDYFGRPTPKSTGRETFNLDWLRPRLTGSERAEDVQSTLCDLTVRTIAADLDGVDRVLICGGGVHNGELMRRLAAAVAPVPVESTAAHGLDPDWVEAILFAWLARQHLAGEPGNLPSVTGASGPRVLGARYPAG